MNYDAIVVGGGAIGLAIARALAPRRSVAVLEQGPVGREASWAAAGMLSPSSEADLDGGLLDMGRHSLGMYPGFRDSLLEETGIDIEYRTDGTLVLASDEEQMAALAGRVRTERDAGFDAHVLSPADVARMEPQLTLEIEGGVFYPRDCHVRPRRLLEALAKSCALRGVELVDGARVEEVVRDGGSEGRVAGVRAGQRVFRSRIVVIAAGAWASQIGGMDPAVEMQPRKGQVAALRMPGPVFSRVIRWKHLYFVPRSDGELVVGATNEDCGFDRSVTVSGLGDLLQGARQMSAAVGAYPVTETWSGFRPMIPDGFPAIGAAGLPGLFYALGHYRNGILMTPATARLIESVLEGEPVPDYAEAVSPSRFALGSVGGL